MVFFFVVFVLGVGFVIGLAFGGTDGWFYGLIIAFVIALIMGFSSYYKSDTLALRVSGARPLIEGEYIRYRTAVEGLAIAAGIPTPSIYVIDDASMNAFATGRNPEHSAIAATTGLLDTMNDIELQGVIAHEMSHIKNYDILIQTITIVLAGTIVLLADIFLRSLWFSDSGDSDNGGWILLVIGIVLAILAPLIAQIIKLAISRKREFLADANGALLTRYPPGLASALGKLRDDPRPLRRGNDAMNHLYISQPLKKGRKGSSGKRSRLFDTHPPIEERIRRLEEMSAGFVPTDPTQTAHQ
ncbi:MAG: M48 family metallopeptidase [Actinobacteria bacterium]|nr:M48 family metallopeptidase [Actinomycetota bacterium]